MGISLAPNATTIKMSTMSSASLQDGDSSRSRMECVITFVLTILILFTNALILLILFRSHGLKCVNKYFFCSMTISDLLMGALVTPFAFVSSIFDRWVFGEYVCHITAYVMAILLLASVYSMMLISMDHYVAIRKPDRHSALLSPVRCACWIMFCWITSLSFCCPPLFGVARAEYYREGYICLIDWNLQRAYFITSGIVVTLPPTVGLMFANSYIFTKHYQAKKEVFEKSSSSVADSARPRYYSVNFVIGLIFFLSWVPWCILQLDQIVNLRIVSPKELHFYFLWIALGNSLWKFGVYVAMCSDFRCGLRSMFARTRVQCTCSKC
ncbi:G-protein coupled receptor 52-like [Lineus longissimus]|uniref:G-protein coupled receptor 52-like n=1 Tax=Lineus longissimus TaxID=88925 RepID=UPI002B4C5148